MMQLEIGGERHDLPAGETTLGSDPGCAIRLAGEQVEPQHAVITNRTGTAAIRRSSPVAHVTVNGIQLGAEPT
ncbi:MAG: FHA domain-containing protein, partial [Gemmatimonadales bacterium]